MIKEGEHEAKVVKYGFGRNAKRVEQASIMFEIVGDADDDRGQRIVYNGLVDDRNSKYTRNALIACGWDGVADVRRIGDALIAAGKVVPITIEHVDWKRDDGQVKKFAAVRGVGFRRELPDMEPCTDEDAKYAMQLLGASASTGDDLPF